VGIDALQLRLASAQQRFATLERRAGGGDQGESKLLPRALKEIESLIADLRTAQDQLVENRRRCDELQDDLAHHRQRYWDLFEMFPDPCVVTGADSMIVEANRAAAELFNVSQRYLVGKQLSVFVCEDRAGFLRAIEWVTPEREPIHVQFKLRPRERAPLDVAAVVRADAGSLRWIVRPIGAPSRVARAELSV